MTYKEKMMQEHPIYVSGEYLGGVKACPGTFFNGAPLACGYLAPNEIRKAIGLKRYDQI